MSGRLYRTVPTYNSTLLTTLLLTQNEANEILNKGEAVKILLLRPVSSMVKGRRHSRSRRSPSRSTKLLIINIRRGLRGVVREIFSFPTRRTTEKLFATEYYHSHPIS